MKTLAQLRVALSVAALVAFTVPAGAQTPKKKPKPTPPPAPKALLIELEQDGRPVPIRDREASLRRAPFVLSVSLPDDRNVFMIASLEKTLVETARAVRPFGRSFRTGIMGAEGQANADRDLFVQTPGDELAHAWSCETGEYRRFDLLVSLGPGCRGARTVASFFMGGKDVPIESAPRKPLHLVFMQGVLSVDGVVTEDGRDWLSLYFDTVPDGVKGVVSVHMEALMNPKKPMAEREAALGALSSMGREAIVAIDASARDARVRANEAAAVASLRGFVAAETGYASANGGLFDSPTCLALPRTCLSKYSGPPLLDPKLLEPASGYKRAFQSGATATRDEAKRAKAGSVTSLKEYAVVAVPELPGESGDRGFCADSSGRMCYVEDGSQTPARDGRCEASCKPLQ